MEGASLFLICHLPVRGTKIGCMKTLTVNRRPWNLVLKPALLLVAMAMLLPAPEASAGSRASKKIGIGIGLITEPFPSLLGYNLSYNLSDKFRLTGGYGSVSATGTGFSLDVKTWGMNLKYFPLSWNFAPFLEGGASSVSGTITGTGTVSGLSVASTGVFYSAGCGIDWQTGIGFNLGLSYKFLFGKNSGNVAAPGLHLGWYF